MHGTWRKKGTDRTFPPLLPCCPISLLFVQICDVIPLICVCTRGLQWTVYMYMQRTRDLLRWSMFGQPSSTAHHRHGVLLTHGGVLLSVRASIKIRRSSHCTFDVYRHRGMRCDRPTSSLFVFGVFPFSILSLYKNHNWIES